MSTAVMSPKQKDNLKTMDAMLTKMKPQIAAALPSHLTADRMARVTMTALQVQPQLLECSPMSVAFGVLQASSLGLEIGNSLGHCYLVPFRNNKAGRTDAQFLIGYKGLCELAYRSGAVSYIDAHAVYEGDEFRFSYGIHQELFHKPCGEEDPAKLTHAWAMATLKGGERKFVVLPKAAIDKTRSRSRAGSSGPWVTDYAAMAIKTAVRRLCKLLPLSIEAQTAVRREELVEAGAIQVDAMVLPDGQIAYQETSLEPTRADEAEEKAAEQKPGTKGDKKASGKKMMAIRQLSEKLELHDGDFEVILSDFGIAKLDDMTEAQADQLIAGWTKELETKRPEGAGE